MLANTGSRYESPDQKGIAHFFEHIVFKGTKKYPTAQDLASTIDGIGANFNAYTSKEYTGYFVHAASHHLTTALDVLSEMMLQPLLRQEDIDREKGVIIEELNMYVDQPMSHVANQFDQLVFGDTGLGHDIIGTKETVSSVTTADFQSLLKQWYGLGNLVVVLAGNAKVIEDPATMKLVKANFSKDGGDRHPDWQDISNRLDGAVQSDKLRVIHRQTDQAHFVLGWPGIKRGDDRKFAASLLATVLGGNMSSRLFSEVREQRGLGYYVHADVDTYHDTGMFGASAGVDPNRVDEALEVTIDQFHQAASGKRPITSVELQRAKDYVLGKTSLGLESSDSVAQYFGMRYLLLQKLDNVESIQDRIKAVTLDEVNQLVAELIQPGQLRLAIIGDFEQGRFEQYVGKVD